MWADVDGAVGSHGSADSLALRLVMGGAACAAATLVTSPLDLVKVGGGGVGYVICGWSGGLGRACVLDSGAS